MEEQYINTRFIIIPVEICNLVNYEEVKETSLETLRISVDGTKTFVKYDINPSTGEGRPSIYSDEYPEYTYDEMFIILDTDEWKEEDTINPL